VHPSRVFLVLFLCFVLGTLLATSLFAAYWFLTDQTLVREDYTRLSEEVDELRKELTTLKERSRAQLSTPEEAGTRQPGTGEDSLKSLAIPSLTEKAPTIRVALLRTAGSVTLQGEGLHINQGPDRAIPLPGGTAEVYARRGRGVYVRGVGTLPQGSSIENRVGPIRIGKEEYPGVLKLHVEEDMLLLVNEVEIERYLQGVVASEMPASWDLEAKKAQAVAARTYAIIKRAEGKSSYDLKSTVDDQVYSGRSADPSSIAAITTTHGEILSHNGYLVSAFYHSKCAGQTEVPINVWPERPSNGNVSVACGFCKAVTRKGWQTRITPEELLETLRSSGEEADKVTGLNIVERSLSGRVTLLDVITDKGEVRWAGNHFRKLLGWNRVRSTRFESKVSGNGFHLTGQGSGHGVGLCQWGTRKMAEDGYDYQDILGHYYPGAGLTQLY